MTAAGSLPGPGDRIPEEAAAAVRARSRLAPAVGVVLGSGLGGAVDALAPEAVFTYEELPGFPPATVPGHAGRLVLGRLSGVPIAAFVGRIHFYEGHPIGTAALPVRLARELGADRIIVTAAVGGLDPGLAPGTLVVGADHLNLMGVNPLRGWRAPGGGPPFVEMAGAYDGDLAELALGRAAALGVPASRGVYVAVPGPSYETPAEVEFLRQAGGTVVGMSVVPEVIPARALGMRVLGLFAVTNTAGGEAVHEEVVRVSEETAGALGSLLGDILPAVAGAP